VPSLPVVAAPSAASAPKLAASAVRAPAMALPVLEAPSAATSPAVEEASKHRKKSRSKSKSPGSKGHKRKGSKSKDSKSGSSKKKTRSSSKSKSSKKDVKSLADTTPANEDDAGDVSYPSSVFEAREAAERRKRAQAAQADKVNTANAKREKVLSIFHLNDNPSCSVMMRLCTALQSLKEQEERVMLEQTERKLSVVCEPAIVTTVHPHY